VRVHLGPFFGDMPIAQLDAKRIEAYDKHLHTKKGQGRRGGKPLAHKTIRNQLGALAVLLNFAVRKKWLSSSPMNAVDLAREGADDPLDKLSFLEPHEVASLVANSVEGSYHHLDRALYTVAAYTGLRQGELRGLNWEHIDFDRAIVHVIENVTHVHRSSPKGKRRRAVPLAPTAAQGLLDLREVSLWTAPEQPVFACPSTGRPMAVTGLMGRYRKALIAAELPPEFSFHDLRHTFGTTMARAGVPVGTIQAWMGPSLPFDRCVILDVRWVRSRHAELRRGSPRLAARRRMLAVAVRLGLTGVLELCPPASRIPRRPGA